MITLKINIDNSQNAFQNGTQLQPNAKQSSNVLKISNARSENSGVYICVATNEVGSELAITMLEVKGKK